MAGEKNPRALDVLAAAFAETGNFVEAQEYCDRAVGLDQARNNTALTAQIISHKQSYALQRPWRNVSQIVE
jgi:hypothetical protein